MKNDLMKIIQHNWLGDEMGAGLTSVTGSYWISISHGYIQLHKNKMKLTRLHYGMMETILDTRDKGFSLSPLE